MIGLVQSYGVLIGERLFSVRILFLLCCWNWKPISFSFHLTKQHMPLSSDSCILLNEQFHILNKNEIQIKKIRLFLSMTL